MGYCELLEFTIQFAQESTNIAIATHTLFTYIKTVELVSILSHLGVIGKLKTAATFESSQLVYDIATTFRRLHPDFTGAPARTTGVDALRHS